MKKLTGFLVALLIFTMAGMGESQNVYAHCDGVWSVEPTTEKIATTEQEQLTPTTDQFDLVNPEVCSGGVPPTGWTTVRSKAVHNNTTSTGTKIYHNYNGGRTTAQQHFNQIDPTAQWKKYVNADGTTTLVRFSTQGHVRLYTSSSGGDPTLWWSNEKIRYLGID